MATLESLPTELHALIFSNLSTFTDLRSLFSTSKSLYTAWESNQRAVLWSVGQAAIPAFSDALVAVRATNISKTSILSNSLPPTPYPIQTLPGTDLKPTLLETQSILSFHKLATHLTRRTCSKSNKKRFFLPHKWLFDSELWTPEIWDVWEENSHRAVYFYFTAGAVLCRAYLEPLLSDKRPEGFLNDFVGILNGDKREGHGEGGTHGGSQYQGWFSESEKEYLRSIPLYNSQTPSGWSSAFADLEALLLQQSKDLSLHSSHHQYHPDPSTGLKKPLSALYARGSQNTQSLEQEHAKTLFNHLLQFLYLIDGEMRYLISLPGDTHSEGSGEETVHTLSLFLFGSFTLMNIDIRRRNDGSEAAFAKPSSLPSSTPSPTPPSPRNSNPAPDADRLLKFPYMPNLLKKIHDTSGLPNTHGDPIWKTPPLSSFFVEHMLRKYFGLRFRYTMFDATIEVRCAWCSFHQAGGVFTGWGPGCGCSVGGDLLLPISERVPPVVFDEDAWFY